MSDQQWGQPSNDPQGQPGPGGQQPHPQGAPAYGQTPSAYPGYPTGRPPIPGPVALAVKLMYVGAGLALLGILFSFFLQDQMRELVEAQAGMTPETADTAMAVGLVFGIVFGLIAVGLWVLNAVFNAKGQQWARILATVLGGINIVFTLISLFQPTPSLSRILSVLIMLLALVVVVLLWRPENKQFYAPQAPGGY